MLYKQVLKDMSTKYPHYKPHTMRPEVKTKRVARSRRRKKKTKP